MFGSHFYHATVRKSVAVFGTIFNNIMVARKKGDGSLINQVKVPLAYGPKQKFLSRIDSDTGQDASVAIKLPRMSFEISGVDIDTTKKLGKRISIDEPVSTTVATAGSLIFEEEIGDLTPPTLLKSSIVDGVTPAGSLDYTDGVKKITTGTGFQLVQDDGTVGATLDNVFIFRIEEVTIGANIPGSFNGAGVAGQVDPSQQTFTEPYYVRIFPNRGLNGILDAAIANTELYVYNIGGDNGVNLKFSDAIIINTQHVFFVPDVEITWQLTQAQMDIIWGLTTNKSSVSSQQVIDHSIYKFREIIASTVTSRKSIKQQTPYNINMQLNIMAKNQDDGLQILEQILPYFQPEYTVAIKPIDDMPTFKQDVPIILNSVSFDDQYEGDYNSRRVLIYTLDFTMKMSFYGPVTTPKAIRQVLIDFTGNTGLKALGALISFTSTTAVPTSFVPGATIYQGSDKSRTWSGTIDAIGTKSIRLVENDTAGYTPGGDLYVNNGGEIQRLISIQNSIALSGDLNTFSSIDISIGADDTESDFTVTTTIDNTDF